MTGPRYEFAIYFNHNVTHAPITRVPITLLSGDDNKTVRVPVNHPAFEKLVDAANELWDEESYL